MQGDHIPFFSLDDSGSYSSPHSMTQTNFFILVFTLMIWNGIPAFAAGDTTHEDQDHYLSELIQQARTQTLAQERYWHLLLHYKKTVLGGYESQEDGPAFFNSPTGKTDPEAELSATLKNFFTPPESLKPGQEHPQCNFPARYKWLKVRLSFDPARLPEQRCERLESWLKDLNPDKVTLVFASHYMNNPASMFGHTLLRIDKKREGPQQKLLDYGVNYAATADTYNILIYTFKGLLGGFRGTFSLFPYYVKVQEYNNLESRDLWEYELDLNDDQMNYMLLHLWELGGNYFDYYYFQENCSYHILSLLEVANPDLHLTDQFAFQVIPADTVKVVIEQPNLVTRRVYRPSLISQMNDKRLRMTNQERDAFHRLVADPSFVETDNYRSLAGAEKALVLDTYLDYAQYRDMRKARTAGVIDKTTRSILLERSKLEYRRDDAPEIMRFSTPPELGHGSARIRFGFGRNQQEFFQELSVHPAYHDLLAKDTGYGKDSQILFFDLTTRYYDDLKKLKLDSFKLFDAISLTPYDSLFRKFSWKLSIGANTIRDLDCHYCNSFKTNYGLGLSYRTSNFVPVLFYSFADVELELSGGLDQNYRLGGGATVGTLINITEDWRAQVTGSYLNFPLGDRSGYYLVSVNQRYALAQNLDLRAEFNLLNGEKEWVLAANYYF
jgi:hypothetical protein